MGKMMDYVNEQMATAENDTSIIEIINVDNGGSVRNEYPGSDSALTLAESISVFIRSDPPEIEEVKPNITKMHMRTKQIHMLIGFFEEMKRKIPGKGAEDFTEPLVNALMGIL